MILVIGKGYVGSAFETELRRRGIKHKVISRSECDYTSYHNLNYLLNWRNPDLVINCAAYAPKPTVNICEWYRHEAIMANTVFPAVLACACSAREIPLAHISTGCLFSGPGPFNERDIPHLSFKSRCGFYVGSKEAGEAAVMRNSARTYSWRVRLIFHNHNEPRNYLAKLMRFGKLHDGLNSLTHLGDFVQNALEMWRRRASFGIYHMTNEGGLWTHEIVEMIKERGLKVPGIWYEPGEFEKERGLPVSDCVLDVSKLTGAGVKVRSLKDAITDSLENWHE